MDEESNKLLTTLIGSKAPAGPSRQMEPMPADVADIRAAARLPKLDQWQRWDAIAQECLRSLSSDLGERYSRTRTLLTAYEVYDGEQRAACAAVKEAMHSEAGMLREGRGLLLFGGVGTGKAPLLAAALSPVASASVPTRWV